MKNTYFCRKLDNLKLETYISRKLFKSSETNFSKTILKISVISVALGLSVMILSIGVSMGFQKAVKEKVAGFEGDIRISNFDYNQSAELTPINSDSLLLNQLLRVHNVQAVQPFALKGGIIKHEKLISGIILKGVTPSYNWSFFKSHLTIGRFPNLTDSTTLNNVLISDNLARKLHLDTSTSFYIYFIQEPPRVRKLKVVGVFNTGFEEFDANYILGDIKLIQKINGWSDNQVSGIEIHLSNTEQAILSSEQINNLIDYNLKAESLAERYPLITDWLKLLDTNVLFIIGLMVIIAGITIIATILILILEKTSFIGVLKSMGASNRMIQKIFFYQAIYLIGIGMIAGNVIGLTLGFLQKKFELIPLDPVNYYMNTVPFHIDIQSVILLNLGVLFVIGLMILWPVNTISNISPIRAIRFK